ncbi:flavoprotein [Dermatophilus congolensis]|uniref:flavoprotein n=1 Tax=Dermatophilus congolensis TaxID=1863 RepID=UPI00352EAD57
MGVTGSMAATRVADHLGALRAEFSGTYTVVMTKTAEHFVTPQILRLAADRVGTR